ncbi:MAG: AAA family ATPase [Candidatus Heimdallarchaeota archaeon]|nr:AAA family ATPase [Candidatus Heimdallarchaeota archaeon]MCK4612397.1 AAA family ATPase [Candidatus Heimdallarchaeota archaeon]
MIKEMIVENFKSIKRINLEFSKINVFIGEPNVGKSNILESLGMFSSLIYYNYSYDKSLISKDFVRYDDLSNLFHNDNISKDIRIITDKNSLSLKFLEEYFKYTGYKSELGIKYDQNREMYRDIIKSNIVFDQDLDIFGKNYSTQIKHDPKKKMFPKVKMFKTLELNKFTSKEFSELKPPYGINLLSILNTNEKLYDYLNDILKDFDLKIMLRGAEEKIELVREVKGKLVSSPLRLVAETFHQLFLLISALQTSKNSILVFEEPETHMFPKYSKYFAEMIAKESNSNQFFVSTHNPYFLISLIEKVNKDDISVFAVSYSTSETKAKKLSKENLINLLQREDPFFNIAKFSE